MTGRGKLLKSTVMAALTKTRSGTAPPVAPRCDGGISGEMAAMFNSLSFVFKTFVSA